MSKCANRDAEASVEEGQAGRRHPRLVVSAIALAVLLLALFCVEGYFRLRVYQALDSADGTVTLEQLANVLNTEFAYLLYIRLLRYVIGLSLVILFVVYVVKNRKSANTQIGEIG